MKTGQECKDGEAGLEAWLLVEETSKAGEGWILEIEAARARPHRR